MPIERQKGSVGSGGGGPGGKKKRGEGGNDSTGRNRWEKFLIPGKVCGGGY